MGWVKGNQNSDFSKWGSDGGTEGEVTNEINVLFIMEYMQMMEMGIKSNGGGRGGWEF